MIRICCNADCEWVGDESECVCPHHVPDELLCPNCYEVTEGVPELDMDAFGQVSLHAEKMGNEAE